MSNEQVSPDGVKFRGAPKSEQARTAPQNELDLQLMTTNPQWGDWDIPDELKEVLGHNEVFIGADGKQYIDVSSLWGFLGFYTRDIRLGNLPFWSGEVDLVEQHINFAGDCLTGLNIVPAKVKPEEESSIREPRIIHFVGSFMRTFRPAITKLEVSQSRGGFLRKRQGTLTQENFNSTLEPKKKKLFQKNGDGGY